MIWTDKPARDYQYRLEMTTGRASSGMPLPLQATSTFRLTYGNPYVAALHGIVLTLRLWYDVGAATLNWEARLETPWVTQVRSGTGTWPSPWKSRIEIDAARLNLSNNCVTRSEEHTSELQS